MRVLLRCDYLFAFILNTVYLQTSYEATYANFEERPQTVANTMSEDVIHSITEKVRKLGGRYIIICYSLGATEGAGSAFENSVF